MNFKKIIYFYGNDLIGSNEWWEVEIVKLFLTAVDKIIDFSGVIASVCIFFISFFVSWGIIARYFHLKVYWVEPVTVYMFIAASFLTIAYTMKENEHIRVDILISQLPTKVAKVLETILMIICLVLFIYVTKISYDMFANSLSMQTKDLSIIQVPIWIPQIFVVLGWAVFVLSLIRHIILIWVDEESLKSDSVIGEQS